MIKFKLDTGMEITVLSETTWNSLNQPEPLKPPDITLCGLVLCSQTSETTIFSFYIWVGKIGSGILNSNPWFHHPLGFSVGDNR